MSYIAEVRRDIFKRFPELFGSKTIDGRTVHVETIIGQLSAEIRDGLTRLLQSRHQFQEQVGHNAARYTFLSPEEVASDPDGYQLTVAQIRQGMLDGFLARHTSVAWRVAPHQPIPPD